MRDASDDKALKVLYDVFATYPGSATVPGCPHCVTALEGQRLGEHHLADLEPDVVGPYAFKAMTTWGGIDDYKHFLPRILELALTADADEHLGLGFDIIAGKLTLAGWLNWPEPEQAAVRGYLGAVWGRLLNRPPEDPWRARDVLPILARISGETAPFLACWSRHATLTSALQLADLIADQWRSIAYERRLGDRWSGVPDQMAVLAWLSSPERREWLENCFFDHLEESAVSMLSEAVDQWQWMTSGI